MLDPCIVWRGYLSCSRQSSSTSITSDVEAELSDLVVDSKEVVRFEEVPKWMGFWARAKSKLEFARISVRAFSLPIRPSQMCACKVCRLSSGAHSFTSGAL